MRWCRDTGLSGEVEIKSEKQGAKWREMGRNWAQGWRQNERAKELGYEVCDRKTKSWNWVEQQRKEGIQRRWYSILHPNTSSHYKPRTYTGFMTTNWNRYCHTTTCLIIYQITIQTTLANCNKNRWTKSFFLHSPYSKLDNVKKDRAAAWQTLNMWNFWLFWIRKDKKMFGILDSLCPSHTLCSVMSNLISLKELIIERGEVQRRSKKAINTYKPDWGTHQWYSQQCCCQRGREEQTWWLAELWDVCQTFLLCVTLKRQEW